MTRSDYQFVKPVKKRQTSRITGAGRAVEEPNLLVLSAEACVTTVLLRSGTGKLVALSVRVVRLVVALVQRLLLGRV